MVEKGKDYIIYIFIGMVEKGEDYFILIGAPGEAERSRGYALEASVVS